MKKHISIATTLTIGAAALTVLLITLANVVFAKPSEASNNNIAHNITWATAAITPTVDYTPQTIMDPGTYTLVYTITLHNENPTITPTVRLTVTMSSYLISGTAQFPPGVTLLPPSRFVWTGILPYCQPQTLTFSATAIVNTPDVMSTKAFTTTWELDDGNSGTMVTRLLLYKGFLPLILRRWPPILDVPTLHPIIPPGDQASYTVSWDAIHLADFYNLHEDTSSSFSNPTMYFHFPPSTAYIFERQGIRRYYYRVRAHNSWGYSAWSNLESVDLFWETEPNDDHQNANGPLRPGFDHYGYPDDTWDVFSIYLPRSGDIIISLANHTGQDVQLLLYESMDNLVASDASPPYHIEYNGPAGWYYIGIYTESGHNSNTPYTLQAATQYYYEENDHWLDAYGPLASGGVYLPYPDDTDDYYYFELSEPATVNVSVEDFAPTSSYGTVVLYGPAVGDDRGEFIEHFGTPDHSSMSLGPHSLGPGKYYIRVYTVEEHYSTTQFYSLMMTY